MTDRNEEFSPWHDPAAQLWLNSLPAWKRMTGLITASLSLDPRKHPHEIRAAAAMVIMFCRDGFWPVEDEESNELDEIVAVARRQMGAVKNLFAQQVKFKPELANDDSFKTLLRSMDEEMRILDARMSDSEIRKAPEPPSTWGKFWSP